MEGGAGTGILDGQNDFDTMALFGEQLTLRFPNGRVGNGARVAVAPKLLTLVYYALRDGEVRSLGGPQAA